MKAKAIALVLGIAASVAMVSSSYGQGYVTFANYNGGSLNAPVTYDQSYNPGPLGPAVTGGWGVGSEFVAVLLYSINSGVSWVPATYVSGSAYPTAFQGADASVGTLGAGYFLGTVLELPTWSSGAVELKVEAYNGTSYDETGFWSGQSGVFLVTPSSGVGTPPDFGAAMNGFTVSYVPEPATCALMGLGGLSLWLFRRRK